MTTPLYFALGSAVLALIYGIALISWINRRPQGDDRMRAIARAIQEGASAYLGRQYKTIALVAMVFFLLIGFFLKSWTMGVGFLVGAALSALAGYIGMMVSVRANVRTTEAAKEGLASALAVAVRGG